MSLGNDQTPPGYGPVNHSELVQISLFHVAQLQALPVSAQQIGKATLADPVLSRVVPAHKPNNEPSNRMPIGRMNLPWKVTVSCWESE